MEASLLWRELCGAGGFRPLYAPIFRGRPDWQTKRVAAERS
jgi:hypothetical protein